RVTSFQVRRSCQPDRAAWNNPFARAPLQAGERFADIEAEASVKRERAIVIGGLHQAHSRRAALICAIHDRLHQLASDAEILRAGIDGNRTDAGDTGTL